MKPGKKSELHNLLIDPDHWSATGRLRHFIFCLVMSGGLFFLFIVGGAISALIFRVLLVFVSMALSAWVGPEQEIGPLIWVPAVTVLGLIWFVIVVSPALWTVFNFFGAVLGLLTAIVPSLSRSRHVVWAANSSARLAIWSVFRFKR